jgi:hypothetical protein
MDAERRYAAVTAGRYLANWKRRRAVSMCLADPIGTTPEPEGQARSGGRDFSSIHRGAPPGSPRLAANLMRRLSPPHRREPPPWPKPPWKKWGWLKPPWKP